MTNRPTIGICGGGNPAHAMAAFLSREGCPCRILTRRPQLWGADLTARFPDGSTCTVSIQNVSSDPAILTSCDVILIAVPRSAIPSVAEQILPFLGKGQIIALTPGSPAVLDMQKDPRWQNLKLCAYYKVPFICRADQYGKQVSLLGSRPLNRIWLSHTDMEKDLPLLESLFQTPLQQLSSAWPFLLSNSNPLLHPSRLLVMFKGYRPGVFYDRNFLFYEERTDESSSLYLQADKELLSLCERCPGMRIGADIVPVADYYEASTPEALTRKIRSIQAFQGIGSPMIRQSEGWIPDFGSRYFTEDIRWGAAPICQYARQQGISTPVLDSFVSWAERMLSLHPKRLGRWR